jgi:hypothetical protein
VSHVTQFIHNEVVLCSKAARNMAEYVDFSKRCKVDERRVLSVISL